MKRATALYSASARPSLLRRVRQQRRELARKSDELDRARAALRLLEAGVAHTTEAFVITTAEIDLPGPEFLFVNPAFTAMTGYTAADVSGKTPRILQGPKTDRATLDRLRGAMQRGEVFHGTAVNYRKDGAEFVLEWCVAPVRDVDGRVTNFIAVQRDVTERARAEARERENERFIQSILDTAPTALYIYDVIERKHVLISPPAARMLGYTPDELRAIGRDVFPHLMHPDDQPRVAAHFAAFMAVGDSDVREIEYRIRHRSGEWRWVLSRDRVFTWTADGRPAQILGIRQDVTRRKQDEEERATLLEREKLLRADAESANRLKDEFLATLSHELRTPLTAILGWSRMLSCGQLDDVALRRGLEVIERNARAQQQLIEDILDVSRIIAGKMRLDVGPIDLIGVINAAVDAVRITAEAKGVALQPSLDPEARSVRGDAARLQQVVWNLASNAVKFTPPGGRVAIALRRVGDAARIEVADSGQGISAEFLPFVFDRFRQADGSVTRKQTGLGLGLAIVHHIAALHGGSVRVASRGPGRGATFTVDLPLGAPGPPESERRARAGVEGGGPQAGDATLVGVRVILVDDDEDARELLAMALAQGGAEVTAVPSASDALREIARDGADIVLSDIAMPTEDGHALLRKLRDLERRRGVHERPIPAIALTAYAAESDRAEALSSGFQRHIAKPVDLPELFASIAALVHPIAPSAATPSAGCSRGIRKR